MEGQSRHIQVDGEAVSVDASKTFGTISQEIRNQLSPDRVVTEIYVDGRAIDIVEEEDLNIRFIKDLGQVSVKSRQVHELFRESLQMAPRICEALVMDATDVVQFVHDSKLTDARERVGEMTSLLEWLLQLISGLETLGSQTLDQMTFSQGKVMDAVQRMQFLLSKMHLDFSNENWDAFCQTIEKDFSKEVGAWKNLFTEISLTWVPRSNRREN